jgi:chloramphenicol O-acetyltransferase type A
MKHQLDIENWKRREHFHFFRQFDEPFFGVCVKVDCTIAYAQSKEKGYSFFLFYLHKILMAANRLEPFRYRIEEQQVMVHDVVNASPTINRADGTFGFAYLDYDESFDLFTEKANVAIREVRQSKGLFPAVSGENVIHFSSMPWLDFTAVSHARSFTFQDSCPKISLGKMTEQDRQKFMPLSIHVHHALMDGQDVALFVDLFQDLMNEV